MNTVRIFQRNSSAPNDSRFKLFRVSEVPNGNRRGISLQEGSGLLSRRLSAHAQICSLLSRPEIAMSEYNPFLAPPTFEETPAADFVPNKEYPGIGRLAYFGWSVLFGIAFQLLLFIVDQAGLINSPESAIAIGGGLLLLNFICSVTIIVLRLQNMGMNGFWVLGLIVPILNLVIAVRLIAAPAGYADHKQLDTPGKILVGLMIGLMVAGLMLVFLVA